MRSPRRPSSGSQELGCRPFSLGPLQTSRGIPSDLVRKVLDISWPMTSDPRPGVSWAVVGRSAYTFDATAGFRAGPSSDFQICIIPLADLGDIAGLGPTDRLYLKKEWDIKISGAVGAPCGSFYLMAGRKKNDTQRYWTNRNATVLNLTNRYDATRHDGVNYYRQRSEVLFSTDLLTMECRDTELTTGQSVTWTQATSEGSTTGDNQTIAQLLNMQVSGGGNGGQSWIKNLTVEGYVYDALP